MIFDAKVEVTCDSSACCESIQIEPNFVYHDLFYSGESGYYDTRTSAIENKLKHNGWFLQDDKQYCCAECMIEEYENSPTAERDSPSP